MPVLILNNSPLSRGHLKRKVTLLGIFILFSILVFNATLSDSFEIPSIKKVQAQNGIFNYTHHYEQSGVQLDVYANIVTAGLQVTKPSISPQTVSARYKKTSSSTWIDAHNFALVKNSQNNKAATSLFDLAENTSYDARIDVGGTIFNIQFTTQPDEFSFTPKRVVYVDKNASSSGSGSQSQPYKTIQVALDNAQPGDQILVAPGVYYEHLRLKHSGESLNWIQLKAQGTPKQDVIIDGSDESFRLENQVGWSEWDGWETLGCRYPIDGSMLWELDLSNNDILTKTHFDVIFRDDKAFFNYAATDGDTSSEERNWSLKNIAIGMRCRVSQDECYPIDEGFYYDSANQKLIIRSKDNPRLHNYKVPVDGWGLVFDGYDWFWIEGFQFRYYQSNGSYDGSILMDDGVSYAIVRNNKLLNAGKAIKLATSYSDIRDGKGSYNRIEDNEITYPEVGDWHYVLTKNNDMRGRAIEVIGAFQNIIRNNYIHDSYLGIGFSWDSNLSFVENMNVETDIYNNRIMNTSSSRLGIQNQWINARIFNNVMKDGHVGFSVMNAIGGPIWFNRNVLHNADGYPFKMYYWSEDFANIFFYHNNIVRTDIRYKWRCPNLYVNDVCSDTNFDWTPGQSGSDASCRYMFYLWGAAAKFPEAMPSVTFRNNIFRSFNYSTIAASSSIGNMDLDYNSYFRDGDDNGAHFPGIGYVGGSFQYSLEQLQSFDIESHGIHADPQFIDIENYNYTLSEGSPVIDRGVVIQGINQDYTGNAPDIGAYEYGDDGQVEPPPVEPDISFKQTDKHPFPDGDSIEYGDDIAFTFSDSSGRGDRDNTSTVKALWDSEYLYIFIAVADTQLNAYENQFDGRVWEDDVVEIFIDSENDRGEYGQGDYRLAINLNKALLDGTDAWSDYSWNFNNLRFDVALDGTLNNNVDTDTGYTVEVRIPWSEIGVTVSSDTLIGFDIAVGDRDTEADGYQYSDWMELTSFKNVEGWGTVGLSEQMGGADVIEVTKNLLVDWGINESMYDIYKDYYVNVLDYAVVVRWGR